MKQPFFSIILPTFNRERIIQRTIQTVLHQTFDNFELIVVDDGSVDDTQTVVLNIDDPRVSYVKKPNGERGAARNTGTKLARGLFLNFVDSDDLLYPNHLFEAYNIIQRNNRIDVFHLGYDVRDEQGQLIRDSRNVRHIRRQIIDGNLLSPNAVFVRKSVAMRHLFNEERALSVMEDWELWLRLCSHYDFPHFQIITSTVVQHSKRSVMTADAQHLSAMVRLFIKLISTNQDLISYYGKALRKAMASAMTYAALHLCMGKSNRREALGYLVDGIRINPLQLFTKRFLVIVRFLLIPYPSARK